MQCKGTVQPVQALKKLTLNENYDDDDDMLLGCCGGYRSMAAILRQKYHLRASCETTRQILGQLDPLGVAARARHRLIRRSYVSRGPNQTWHVDGYDKLRPYGFAISG